MATSQSTKPPNQKPDKEAIIILTVQDKRGGSTTLTNKSSKIPTYFKLTLKDFKSLSSVLGTLIKGGIIYCIFFFFLVLKRRIFWLEVSQQLASNWQSQEPWQLLCLSWPQLMPFSLLLFCVLLPLRFASFLRLLLSSPLASST